ncbi:MAG TPA: S4 domain-containing protein, partial [Clostridia bacterium]|nr:S4 domain-containing protein [Clostridia bacterium]
MTRADLELVRRNLIKSRTKAADAIKRGLVKVNGVVIDKPSFECTESD